MILVSIIMIRKYHIIDRGHRISISDFYRKLYFRGQFGLTICCYGNSPVNVHRVVVEHSLASGISKDISTAERR